MALNKIKKDSITADAIDATKVADDAISEEHLDVTAITGHTELSAAAASNDVLLVFDTSAGTLKKIAASNVGTQAVTLTSVSPTNVVSGDGTGNHTFTITGTNFTGGSAELVNTSGTIIAFDSVTVNSSTQITGVIAKSSLPNSGEPYDVRVFGSNGLQATLRNQINVDASPAYVTAAGTLGTVSGGSAITPIDVVAADPDSAGAVTFEFQSGSLPAGLSSATVNENGVSKFRISGTPTNPVANTTTNFTLRAVDAASNTSSRAFSITVNRTFTSTSFTSSGTFSVPSGTTSISEVLVVAGGGAGGNDLAGGGGAGGLVYFPGYPVAPGGTITVTVGAGGSGLSPCTCGNPGQDSAFGSPGDPGFSPTSTVLTAKGGGGGGGGPSSRAGASGGSGGGGGGHGGNPSPGTGPATGGPATQPTQPGNSGAYGFGNAGGNGWWPGNPTVYIGGGGGGAGAVGGAGNGPQAGGAGKAYTIADGTTSVYYAGGGGGQIYNGGAQTTQNGGQGGGGGGSQQGSPLANGQGGANKGGGGGGAHGIQNHPCTTDAIQGGKGVVIVRY